jgi:hypothetical protein
MAIQVQSATSKYLSNSIGCADKLAIVFINQCFHVTVNFPNFCLVGFKIALPIYVLMLCYLQQVDYLFRLAHVEVSLLKERQNIYLN